MSKTNEVLMEENRELQEKNIKLEEFIKKTINSLGKMERTLERKKGVIEDLEMRISDELSKLRIMTNSLTNAVNRGFSTQKKIINLLEHKMLDLWQ